MRAVDYLRRCRSWIRNASGWWGTVTAGTHDLCRGPRTAHQAVFASGPVSDFRGHGLHWAVPRGAGNSQSLPNLRPYVLDHTLPIPAEFYEWTSLIAPRPLWVNQAVGERRPREEENHAAVREVYQALGAGDRVTYQWCAGDHDFPPVARGAAVGWFKRWFDHRSP
jgi:hypothetical protein